jgi:glycerophosphoryl diester phosphodiesterase
MLCIGHRGAMGHEPENTLLSIRKAIALGVDAIEIDVHNVENKLVVIHDRDLARTTNGTGYLEDNSFAYVRSLDAGKGEQVPTLEEVLETVDRQVIINIELKGSNTARLVISLIQERIKAGWSYTDFVVSSFDHDQLHQVKAICPEITTGMLIYGLPWQYLTSAQELGADLVIPNLDYVTSKLMESAHQQGLQVWVYTVNQPHDIKLMRALGADGIFTNYPERVFSHSTD